MQLWGLLEKLLVQFCDSRQFLHDLAGNPHVYEGFYTRFYESFRPVRRTLCFRYHGGEELFRVLLAEPDLTYEEKIALLYWDVAPPELIFEFASMLSDNSWRNWYACGKATQEIILSLGDLAPKESRYILVTNKFFLAASTKEFRKTLYDEADGGYLKLHHHYRGLSKTCLVEYLLSTENLPKLIRSLSLEVTQALPLSLLLPFCTFGSPLQRKLLLHPEISDDLVDEWLARMGISEEISLLIADGGFSDKILKKHFPIWPVKAELVIKNYPGFIEREFDWLFARFPASVYKADLSSPQRQMQLREVWKKERGEIGILLTNPTAPLEFIEEGLEGTHSIEQFKHLDSYPVSLQREIYKRFRNYQAQSRGFVRGIISLEELRYYCDTPVVWEQMWKCVLAQKVPWSRAESFDEFAELLSEEQRLSDSFLVHSQLLPRHIESILRESPRWLNRVVKGSFERALLEEQKSVLFDIYQTSANALVSGVIDCLLRYLA